jgi:hypothetical protein
MPSDLKPFAGISTAEKQTTGNLLLENMASLLASTSISAFTVVPDGQYHGVDVLSQLLDTGSGLGLNVNFKSPAKLDAQSAAVPSDAPVSIQWNNGAVGPGPLIDTQGYSSIVISFSGAQGTYLFQTSNDPQQLTATLANAGGWPSGGAGAVVSSVVAAAGATYSIPITGRYFRLYCSVAGTPAMVTIYLRSAGVAPVISNLVIQGNVAAGAVATALPLAVGAVDQAGLTRRFASDSNGYLSMGGPIKAGWQVGVYNASYNNFGGLVASATAAQSTFNPVPMGGLDKSNTMRTLLLDQAGAMVVRHSPTDNSEQSLPELLAQSVATQRVMVRLLAQLVALMRGLRDPLPDDDAEKMIEAEMALMNIF